MNQPHSSYAYPTLRSSTVTDALGHQSNTSQGVECNWGSGPPCYVFTVQEDAMQRQTLSLADPLGRTDLVQVDTGTGASSDPYAAYSSTSYTFDALNETTKMQRGSGPTTTFTYDGMGRQTGMTDPDRGAESYTYDPNGSVTQTVDAPGSSGTTYAGYDGLNRQLWRNTTNSASGAYVTYGYDTTVNGNVGVGRLTSESFSNANGGVA